MWIDRKTTLILINFSVRSFNKVVKAETLELCYNIPTQNSLETHVARSLTQNGLMVADMMVGWNLNPVLSLSPQHQVVHRFREDIIVGEQVLFSLE